MSAFGQRNQRLQPATCPAIAGVAHETRVLDAGVAFRACCAKKAADLGHRARRPLGYAALPTPDGAPERWAEELECYACANEPVAHIFKDSWSTPSFKAFDIDERGEGYIVFYRKDFVDHELAHNLDLGEWSVSRSWVIIEKGDLSRPEPRASATRQSANTRRNARAADRDLHGASTSSGRHKKERPSAVSSGRVRTHVASRTGD